jgi:nitrite reductase (NADH) small subunit
MVDDGWHRIVRSDALKEGHTRLGRAGIRQVALARVGGKAFAFKNNCPHAGNPLHNGQLRGHFIECTRHRWRFDVVDGSCPDHPEYSLRVYPLQERADGWVWVQTTEDQEIW